MEVITMKLVNLVKPEKNVRIHTKQQLKEFERSVTMFGQIRPIVVDENNVILAGNGLYDTLVAMGRETADVYRYDNLTDNQKKKLMIADNKIFSLGIENLDTFNHFLEELQGDLDIPGFDEEILNQMVADADEITEKLSEYGSLDDEEIKIMKENNEKREQKGIESNSFHNQSIQSENADISLEPTIDTPLPVNRIMDRQTESTAEQRHIICPKCGEKIWL